MRIVAVTPAVPHPFGDTAAKWLYVLLRELLRGGHSVSCIAVSEENPELIADAEARLRATGSERFRFRWLKLASSSSPIVRKLQRLRQPFSELHYADGFEAALEQELSQGYDVLHLEQLWTGWVGLQRPRSLLNIHHFEVIDWEDRVLENATERKAWWQMRRATKKIVSRTERMRVFTPRLLEKAKTMNRDAKYWVLPFALDLSLYPMQPVPETPVVGLLGSMHWVPSRSAGERLLTRIWPLIKEKVPAAKLYIAGWNARKYLARYLPPGDDTVELDENLPHPSQFFSRVSVMAYAPSRGSGMKIKVMESMCYGVPVVTTWEGVEGIDYRNGEHCWVEESDEAIAQRVCELLDDRQQRQRMRQAARTLMEEHYSPVPVVDRMMRIYDEVACKG